MKMPIKMIVIESDTLRYEIPEVFPLGPRLDREIDVPTLRHHDLEKFLRHKGVVVAKRLPGLWDRVGGSLFSLANSARFARKPSLAAALRSAEAARRNLAAVRAQLRSTPSAASTSTWSPTEAAAFSLLLAAYVRDSIEAEARAPKAELPELLAGALATLDGPDDDATELPYFTWSLPSQVRIYLRRDGQRGAEVVRPWFASVT